MEANIDYLTKSTGLPSLGYGVLRNPRCATGCKIFDRGESRAWPSWVGIRMVLRNERRTETGE